TVDPASPGEGGTVTFVASANGGTGPFSFAWDFGDGSVDSGPSTTHVYVAGAYTVTLIVTASGGGTFSVSKTVTVAPLTQSQIRSWPETSGTGYRSSLAARRIASRTRSGAWPASIRTMDSRSLSWSYSRTKTRSRGRLHSRLRMSACSGAISSNTARSGGGFMPTKMFSRP